MKVDVLLATLLQAQTWKWLKMGAICQYINKLHIVDNHVLPSCIHDTVEFALCLVVPAHPLVIYSHQAWWQTWIMHISYSQGQETNEDTDFLKSTAQRNYDRSTDIRHYYENLSQGKEPYSQTFWTKVCINRQNE